MRRSLDGPTGQQHLQYKFRLSQHEDPYWWRCSKDSQQHMLHANMDPYNEYKNQQLQMIMQRVQTLLGSLAVSVTAVSPKVSRSNILLLTTINSNVVPKSHACLCGRIQKTKVKKKKNCDELSLVTAFLCNEGKTKLSVIKKITQYVLSIYVSFLSNTHCRLFLLPSFVPSSFQK